MEAFLEIHPLHGAGLESPSESWRRRVSISAIAAMIRSFCKARVGSMDLRVANRSEPTWDILSSVCDE